MTTKLKALPKTLFVYREPDENDSYLMTWEILEEAAENAEDGTLIGTYTLSHQAKYKTETVVKEVK